MMLLMGFGCNVPALMGTRVMRSRGLRLLTMLVIPFSLCSARLQVFVFLDRRPVLARASPAGAVRAVPRQLPDGLRHRPAVQEPVATAASRCCSSCRRTGYRRSSKIVLRELARGASFSQPRQPLHHRRRGADLAADASTDRCAGRPSPDTLAGNTRRLAGAGAATASASTSKWRWR
ncbi:MAG: hypothetical protein MZV65_30365 [Chromatiales bacterium]|nr:hypothetical protein [Chromatiales bacterium]